MSEEKRAIATLSACAGAMDLIGKQREETLAHIAQSLSVMLGSAVALVDGMGNVVGYQIKTGALHRVLGYMAGLDHPVTVPLCRTQIVLNHESSPWPLEGKPIDGVAPSQAPSDSYLPRDPRDEAEYLDRDGWRSREDAHGVLASAPARLSNADIYAIADRFGHRYRTADEEGVTFDKHAVLDFARAILAHSAEAPVASAIGEAIARIVHRAAGEKES